VLSVYAGDAVFIGGFGTHTACAIAFGHAFAAFCAVIDEYLGVAISVAGCAAGA